ncbi:hypothetical protein V6Z11_D12G243600 [Gossypium hirsutum]
MVSPYKRQNPHGLWVCFHFKQVFIGGVAMEGSPNPNNKTTPYQKISGRCSGTDTGSRRLSTRFKGVLPLESHKWGARVSFNYRAYWLGTYYTEEEAAIAYDRAALKLLKTDAPLNLPYNIYTPQEKSFQSWYSDDEILNMIKDKTYSSHFTAFLVHQSLAKKTLPGSLTNAKGLSYEMLFHKELTQIDVSNADLFQIPNEYALQFLPPVGNNSSGIGVQMGRDSIDITFYDKYYRPWNFRYSYWGRIKVFLFAKGWRDFVIMNSLNPGDTVIFYGYIHRNVPEKYIVGERYVDGINGVKLFGVRIG